MKTEKYQNRNYENKIETIMKTDKKISIKIDEKMRI